MPAISGWNYAANFGSEDMPSISARKIIRQFWVGRYAGKFGSEDMPASSGPNICQQFWVQKYPGNFGSVNMPAISGKKKCRQCRIGTECRQIWAGNNSSKFGQEQKMPVFSGQDKIAGKPAIAGELRGLLRNGLFVIGIISPNFLPGSRYLA